MTFEERVQKKAEAHLSACNEALFEELGESPAVAPYCGCDTCVVREVLTVCWDEMFEEAKRAAREDIASGAMPHLQLVRKGDALCREPSPAHD